MCFSEISAEYMGTRTQHMPPQAPVTILPITKNDISVSAEMSKIQPLTKTGTRIIIVHFRPILSTSKGTRRVPSAAPMGNTDAITFIAKSSNWLLSISTHGALQPRPHPNENPPMQAARKKERSSLTANTTTRIYVTRMAICSPWRVRNDGCSLSRDVLETRSLRFAPLFHAFFSPDVHYGGI